MRRQQPLLVALGLLAAVHVAVPAGATPIDPASRASTTPRSSGAGPAPGLELSRPLPPELQQAAILLDVGNRAEAADSARAVIFRSSNPIVKALAYEMLGTAQYLDGYEADAVESLTRAVSLDPQASSAMTKLGSIAAAAADLPSAVAWYRRSLQAAPANPTASRRLAAVLQAQGDVAGAVGLYEDLLRARTPAAPDDIADLANLLNQQKRFDDAIALLLPKGGIGPAGPKGQLLLGVAQLGAGRPAEAASILAQANASHPGDSDVLLVLGAAQRQSGQLPESATTLRSAVSASPGSAAAQYQLGLTLLRQSQFDAARDAFAAAATQSPGTATTRTGLATALLLGGKPDDAVVLLGSLAARPGATLADFVALATAYQMTAQPNEVETVYRDAVARFPRSPEAYGRLGASLAMQRKYEDARIALSQGLELAPEQTGLLRELALVQARLGHPQDAVVTIDRATAADPGNLDLRFLAAGLNQDAGNAERAIGLYRSILAGQPRHALALNNLASMLTSRGDAAAAVDLARQAVSIAPDNPALRDTLGWSLFKAGQFGEAVANLQQAHTLLPSDPDILYRLALSQNAVGDKAKARQNAREALRVSPTFKDAASAQKLAQQR